MPFFSPPLPLPTLIDLCLFLCPLYVDCSAALTEYSGKVVKQTRFNPKALRAPEMYGEVRHNKRPHLSIGGSSVIHIYV